MDETAFVKATQPKTVKKKKKTKAVRPEDEDQVNYEESKWSLSLLWCRSLEGGARV